MARYLIRVVLHDGSTENYLTLYKYMEEKDFTDEITISGSKQKLPDGEYIFDSGKDILIDLENVNNILKVVLSKVKCKYSYTITKIDGPLKVCNLEQVR